MIIKDWPTYQSLSDATRFVRALKITGRKQANNGLVTLSFGDGYPDIQIDPAFNGVWNPAIGGWVVEALDGSMSYISDSAFSAQFKLASGSQVAPGSVSDASVSASAAIKGTKIVTASVITSAGSALTIPAGSTLDAALKIIADKVNPA